MPDVDDEFNEIDKLRRISDEDFASGRHSMAPCSHYVAEGVLCRNPVRYSMTVVCSIPGEDYLDTEYFCEAHKPEDV